MVKHEKAWAAGVLEGEGCFDLNNGPHPRIRVEMTDHDVVQRLHALIGGRLTRPKPRRAHHLPSMMLSVCGDRAVKAMREILPWMGTRRTAKIEAILAEACN